MAVFLELPALSCAESLNWEEHASVPFHVMAWKVLLGWKCVAK